MTTLVDEQFVQILNQLMRERRLSASQLARWLGKSRATVSRWLTGEKHPDREVLADLATRLGLTGLERQRFFLLWSGYADPPLLPATGSPLELTPHSPELPEHSFMPFHRNRRFVGREHVLGWLSQQLAVVGSTTIVAGMAGLGKTQLACEFVYRYGAHFWGGVFWLSFADPAGVGQQVALLGGEGHLSLHESFAELPFATQIRLVRAAWQEPKPRLLIFDNCEDEELLRQWRPTTGGCRVLVTSRRLQWQPELAFEVLPLSVLEREASLALLQQYCPDVDLDAPDLQALAAEMGDLPLALGLSGRYLARYRRSLSIGAYLAQLRTANIVTHAALQGTVCPLTQHHAHVERSLQLSYSRLDPAVASDKAALHILAYAAHLAPGEAIAYDLLHAIFARDSLTREAQFSFADGLTRLIGELGLLEEVSAFDVRMHRLVHAFVQLQGHHQDELVAVEQVIAERSRLANANSEFIAGVLLQHLRYTADRAQQRVDALSGELCFVLGWQLRLRTELESLRWLHRAVAIRTALYGEQHVSTAEALHIYGYGLLMASHFQKAQTTLEQALTIYHTVLPASDPAMLPAQVDFAYARILRGDYAFAKTLLVDALKYYRRLHGTQHPEVARIVNHIGFLLQFQGRYHSSRRCLALALRMRERLLPIMHRDIVFTTYILGLAHYYLGAYTEAKAIWLDALEGRSMLYGPESESVGESLCSLALLALAENQFEQAVTYIEKGLQYCEAFHGPISVISIPAVEVLGKIHWMLGEYQQAYEHYTWALAAWKKLIGPACVRVHHALHALGCLALAVGNSGEAQHYLEKALALRETHFGPHHAFTRETRAALATMTR
jgi:tetratricopeptide (TPR) repeat protein/transcriptional regulator with XRE-family HTH domain